MASHTGELTGSAATAAASRAGRPGADGGSRGPVAGGRAAAPAVRATRLVRRFGGRAVLKELDLTLAPGEFIALLGRSGSGKSTLLRAVAGLDHRVAGSGELVVPERVSLSFQDSRLLPWLRLLDNVILGMRDRQARQRGSAALAEVGLEGREKAWPHELSGGEQQRAALARALVRDPELLLADEPFGALDALTRIRMHGLLRELYERHRPAVLLVTHDVDEAVELADRVLVLEDGRISVDLAVDLPTPRTRRDPRFEEYRETLLKALGVTAEPAQAPSARTGPPQAAAPPAAAVLGVSPASRPHKEKTRHVPQD
ncbi:aliphatic sulfonates import ATP-binding protein SsuB 1 [Streptomyces sulfonofaciens]|uniref:Aliphatic sulfonates import ATP-binding protein SsuB 1 n=1 Tax=Streptomyces sulfonofaciens TaxID=68272 RepID=A0A919FVI2_9ACTN|nr:ABC transporter ATP-binding protein [Streptomyces sulfonofaciens]GHH72719.1 aliphatic sulfonates import ATP-binding protein SsuB 1 [Streptomyces sulfonofaciens]